MTNSTTVAMTSNGSVKYEMRLLFNRCQGESPASCEDGESAEPCGSIELEFFINELVNSASVRRTSEDLSLQSRTSRSGGIKCGAPNCHAATFAACVPESLADGEISQETEQNPCRSPKSNQRTAASDGMSGQISDGQVEAVASRIQT